MTNGTGKNDLKERFIELRASGLSYADAAGELGISKPTLIAWSKELAIQIEKAHNHRLDALFECFAVGKEKRIEAFGKRLDAILTELDTRDLKDVETPALLSLALKYGEYLREEHVLLTPASARDLEGKNAGKAKQGPVNITFEVVPPYRMAGIDKEGLELAKQLSRKIKPEVGEPAPA